MSVLYSVCLAWATGKFLPRIFKLILRLLANFSHSSLSHEPFPNLLDAAGWYHTPLLIRTTAPSGPSGGRKKKIGFTTVYDQMGKCFQAVGIRGSSVTHLPRAAGAKSLEQKGVSEEQIRRLGRLTPPSPAEL